MAALSYDIAAGRVDAELGVEAVVGAFVGVAGSDRRTEARSVAVYMLQARRAVYEMLRRPA